MRAARPPTYRELNLEGAQELDGVWVAAGLGDAPALPPSPLGWELVLDDADLLSTAVGERGASLPRRSRRLVSVGGHAYHAFLPLIRAARELVPLNAEALAVGIACEARGDSERVSPRPPPRRALSPLVLRLGRRLEALEKQAFSHQRAASQHYRWLMEMDLRILPDDALRTTIGECAAIHRASRALEIDATLDLITGYSVLQGLLRRTGVEGVEQVSATALVPDALELASLTPALALSSAVAPGNGADGSASRPGLQAFFSGFGERGPCEREPSAPRWIEAPNLIERTLDLLAHTDLKLGAERQVSARHARAHQVSVVLGRLSTYESFLLARLLPQLNRIVILRSRLRLVRARTLAMLRTAALDVDRRLTRLVGAEPGTAFFLRFAELLRSTWRPDPQPIELAAARRRSWQAAADRPPPPAVLGRAAAPISDAKRFSGVGLGDARVTGPATVARDFADGLRLAPGGVLVVRSLDPGWAPLLAAAGAIVTDSGGIMDEGVLSALALGVPVVLGTREATSRVRDGQSLRVDAASGRVTAL